MPGVELVVTVLGKEQLRRALSRFGENITDWTEAFRALEVDFKGIMANQFSSQGSYGGGGWAPLSPSYAEWKARYFPGMLILQASGLLAESLVEGNPWSIVRAEAFGAEFGTILPYGRWHQTGTGRMPPRPIVQLTEADKMRWMKILHRWLVEKARQSFLGGAA